MTEPDRQPPGFYGKVPGLGDFVHRRLPRSFRDPWDEWLRFVVAASKTQLDEHWLNTYLSSPIWRWTLGPGPAQASAWAGVLMPSVDRVGRYFPLTLAVGVAEHGNPFRLAREQAGWFDAAEALALSTLDEDEFDLESFSESVAELGDCGPPDADLPELLPPTPWRVAVPSVSHIEHGCEQIADSVVRERSSQYSLWWTDGSDLVEPSMLVCDGLPDEQQFIALLDGAWMQRGWNEPGARTVDELPET